MAYIDIEIKNLSQLKSAIKQSPQLASRRLAAALQLSANAIRVRMKQEVPRRTGNLSRSIQSNVSSGLVAVIGPNLKDAPYAVFVHEGTRPYVIKPVSKKALYWEGALHPVKKVHHPGIKANKFVVRTAQSIEKEVNKIFNLSAEKIVDDIRKLSV